MSGDGVMAIVGRSDFKVETSEMSALKKKLLLSIDWSKRACCVHLVV